MSEYRELNAPLTSDFHMEYYCRNDEMTQPARIFPPHIHDTLEIYILLEGDVSFMVEHHLYRMKAGDLLFSKPNEMHNCILNSNSLHRHYCFWFTPDCDFLFSDFLAHDFGEGNLITPPPEVSARILEICARFHALAEKEADPRGQFQLITEMLYLASRHISPTAQTEPMPELLRRILDDIHDNLAEIPSLSWIYRKYFISASTLNRLFRRYLHTSPQVYIETTRLACSRTLLRQGKSVTEACFASGFSNCSNYIRLFRRRFGITPKQYRDQRP